VSVDPLWVQYLEPIGEPERVVSVTNLVISSEVIFPPGLNRQRHSVSFDCSTLGPLDLDVAYQVLATAILHLSRRQEA